jgi:hypothetical protein
MRNFLILGAALLAAAPVQAQPPIDEDEDRAEVALDPRELQAMTGVMDRLVGAVMDLPIGGIVAAVDPLGRGEYRRDDTVRDMAERDDPYVEERLRDGIRGTSRSIGVMSHAIARMMPVLERSLREMEHSLQDAIEDVRGERP